MLPDRRCCWWGRSTSTAGRDHSQHRTGANRPQLLVGSSSQGDCRLTGDCRTISDDECFRQCPLRPESSHNSGDNPHRGKHQHSFVGIWLMSISNTFTLPQLRSSRRWFWTIFSKISYWLFEIEWKMRSFEYVPKRNFQFNVIQNECKNLLDTKPKFVL